MIQLTECPRDAMQGIHEFIPTAEKVNYINALLKVGFPVIDAGSFVSPKVIPQLADTKAVFEQLDFSGSETKLLAIVANERGAEDAVANAAVSILGFPLSVSETFQRRNTNSGIAESMERVEAIHRLSRRNKKDLVIYLSMAFGNPYGDPWSEEIVYDKAVQLKQMGITRISLADTTGMSESQQISSMFSTLIPQLNDVILSAHLHAVPEEITGKVKAGWEAGCRHFDTAIKGFGGCPMASDTLTGNIATERVLQWCRHEIIETGLNADAFNEAQLIADRIFQRYH